ncbi:MAG: efflux RND transporter permease subunit [Porticoccaceae bacterium]
MNALKAIVSRSRATLSLMLLVLLAGIMSRASMPIEVNPNVTVPAAIIMVRHEGISPEDGSRLLIRPIEKELKTLDGLEEMIATARESVIYLFVRFDINLDIDQVIADVRESVDRAKAEFPEETKEPIVNAISPSPEPDVVLTFSGDKVGERDLFKAAKFFQRKIEGLSQVLETNLSGHREEVVEVILDPSKLELYKITAGELIYILSANNLLIPAGQMDAGEGRFGIKVPALIETEEDIRDIPIRSNNLGVITLSDIASIQRTFKDSTGFSTLDGKPTIALDVRKRLKANSIDTIAAVRQVVDLHRDQFSQEIEIDYMFDSSEYAQSMVSELMGNIFTAMVLVLALVVATLGIRSGLLVGFGIPFCLLGSMIIVSIMGFSFNFMVMFGLLLSLGMLIDGSIVVVEFANTKIVQGTPVKDAYLQSIRRMAIPVMASTGTTLAAFLPMLFWPGVSGNFMMYLPVTVFSVLAWSLIYALIFAPTLGVSLANIGSKMTSERVVSEKPVSTLFTPLLNNYLRLLHLAIARPLVTAGLSLMLLVGIFYGYGKFGAGLEFFTETENRFGMATLRAQGNLSVEEQRQLTEQVEARFSHLDDIKHIYASSSAGQLMGQRDASRDQISSYLIELHPRAERNRSSAEVFAEIRALTKEIPGVFATAASVEGGPPVGKDIQIQISSTDRSAMYREAAKIRRWIESNVAGLRDVEDSLPLAGVQWEMAIDRSQAAMLGVDVSSIGQMVQLVTNGMFIGEFRPDNADEEVEIRVRYPSSDRKLESLDGLRVNTAEGAVPISSFTQRQAKTRVDTIQRIDMMETVFVLANTEDGYLADNQVKQISQWLDTQSIDPAVKITFRGANEEQAESAEFLSTAFTLAMGLMLILLVAQFNSFYQSILILFSVVMSTAGVLLGLLVTQSVFSTILTGVGIVALAGIVVNNNIVLIDSYNHLRRNDKNLSLKEAVFEAAKSRFRPVMLTTVTTIAGLLPLATGFSVDMVNRKIEVGGMVASWWQPLASAIVNGLVVATIMTLLLTPAMLLVPEMIKRYINDYKSVRKKAES